MPNNPAWSTCAWGREWHRRIKNRRLWDWPKEWAIYVPPSTFPAKSTSSSSSLITKLAKKQWNPKYLWPTSYSVFFTALAFSTPWLLIILAQKLRCLIFTSSFIRFMPVTVFVCISLFIRVSLVVDSRRQVESCPGYQVRFDIVDNKDSLKN